MSLKFKYLLLILFFFQINNFGYAKISVSTLFSDHMVLQQKAKVKIWGWAESGEKISIKTSWNSSEINVTSNEKGVWYAWLHTKQSGGSHNIVITAGKSQKIIKDILFGEVWICSGQSNMEMPLKGWLSTGCPVEDSQEFIQNSANNNIRLFNVQRRVSFTPQDSCVGEWKVCSPEAASNFSAVGGFFAKMLNDSLQVPIGMISAPWGGSPVEAWIPFDDAQKETMFQDLLNDRTKEIKASQKPEDVIVKDLHQWLKSVSEKSENNNDFIDVTLPGALSSTKLGNYEGAICFQKEINLPEKWEEQILTLSLGTIDDIGQVFINDQLVWEELRQSHSYKKCKLTIPANALHNGKNIIEVKLLNILWGGGLTGTSEEMFIHPEGDSSQAIHLSGAWKAKKLFSMKEVSPMPKEGVPKFDMVSALYNGMINPIISYKVKGFIWYQGESNVDKAAQYQKSFTRMIESWRNKWNSKQLPFYYVQIAPFQYGGDSGMESAYLREAQLKTLELSNTGMAVTLDIGSENNIHPPKKEEVGNRLTLLALYNDYNFPNLICSGPIYKSYSINKNTIIIKFEDAKADLSLQNSSNEFEICGKDKKFLPAHVVISGKYLIVSHPDIINPIAVRYAWRDIAKATLFNTNGLPASSFRTDNWDINEK